MVNEFYNFNRIVIVAYRLPFRMVKKKTGPGLIQNSGGLVSAILSLSQKLKPRDHNSEKLVWVGMGDKQMELSEKDKDLSLYPVKIPEAVNEKYYSGFCNNTIWPLFHYFPSRTIYNEEDFDAYVTANNLFYKKLKEIIQPGDLVWVHDYQLFLLPQLIRKHFPEIAMGFFLHIPFPSFEMFRLLPRRWRNAILSGMTGADVIGFHTNDYTQHFIKSIKRTLGWKADRNNIDINGRLCKADTFPIGIDFKKFSDACFYPEVITRKEKLKKILNGCKLVFSIDRLDYSKGFLFRLRAFERFLEKYPEWRFKVVFNMIVIPSRDTIPDYQKMKKEIEAAVGKINGKYCTLNWRPVIYQYHSVNFKELIAVYNLSDAGFITPLRDGMNLVAKEFVACQHEDPGILILSEMAGAASELNEAILINPADIEESADSLNMALTMPVGEKKRRIEKMQSRLSRYDVFRWASDFFHSTGEVRDIQNKMQVNMINENIAGVLRTKYTKSRKCLFLIDYDGTPVSKTPEQTIVDRSSRKILEFISGDEKNKVVIISGRDREYLDEQFRNMNLVLVAEHGCFMKNPGEEWKISFETDLSWKKKIIPVLENYVDRCNGSLIEEKFSSLVWHYRNTEEDFASLRINELRDDLSEIMRNEPRLHILEGYKLIEIKSVLYDKGITASNIIKNDSYDFILAVGDDHTDEDLFKVLPEHGISIRIGRKLTNAKFSIKNQSEIVNLFKSFSLLS